MTNFPNGVTTTTVNTTGAVGVAGALAVTGASTLTGAVVASSTANIAGAARLASTLLVNGAVTLASTTNVTGAVILASTLQVNGASTLASAGVTGLTNTGTLKVGSGGDTINSILTYTSAAANIAAVNIAAATMQEVALTVTGVVNTDTLLRVTPTNVIANQYVIGYHITGANAVSVAIYTSANTNAGTNQTFKVVVKR